MKNNTTILGTTCLLSLCSALMVAPAFAEDAAVKQISLGTSNFVMTVDAGYELGELSKEDTSENQVAYFTNEASEVDFDVYQWAKADNETLAEAAKEEADLYEAEVKEAEINGIAVASYEAVEEWKGEEFNTITYLAEDNNDFVEVVFWLDGESALEKAEAMINTLELVSAEKKEGVIALGSSSLSLKPEKEYKAGEISKDDTTDSQVGYFYSDDSLVDFDVYQWAKADDETLADAAKEEADKFGSEVKESVYNDISFAYYEAVEESDGKEFPTVTYITEDGNNFVEIVFWMDGEDAPAEVDAILSTIAK